jgi:hypothetical protein
MSSDLTWGREFDSNRPLNPIMDMIINNIYIGKVALVNDVTNSGIIQVFIDGVDRAGVTDENLPLCYPLMSRVIHVMPKVDEAVLVLMASTKEGYDRRRYWIGPLLTNYEKIGHDNLGSGRNLIDDPLLKSQNNKKRERDIFPIDTQGSTTPNLDDVTIVGRNNTDIRQSENKITLRAGKHKKNIPREINDVNPVYSILEFIDNNNSYSLTAGDEIYLISHKGRNTFKKVLTNSDIQDLKTNSQSMLYGELTVEYLKILTQAFLTHIHQHPQKEPIKKEVVVDLEKKLNEIQDLLAKNIKIN